MSVKYSVIIPTINQTILVKECIDSLLKYEKNKNYEVIVVDDGSSADTQDWLSNFCKEKEVKLILKKENKGFSNSVNMGMALAEGEIYILCNNDILFTSPILDEFDNSFNIDKKIGIVGAKLFYPDGKIQHAGVDRFPKTAIFDHPNKYLNKDSIQVNNKKYSLSVTGALLAIKKECHFLNGDFDENFFIAYEDVEYSLRAWKNGFKVLYNPKIEAIHLEGFTRGSDNLSKLKKGKEWVIKEQNSLNYFYEKLNKEFDIEKIDDIVISLNEEIKLIKEENENLNKLEIGCGYNPQPGYIHLDVRDLPDVEYICNFEKEKLPFEDNTLDEILTNHVIEHVSWRSLPFVFKEWHRVLKPNGKIIMRTPDLEFICRAYLSGITTPEHPNDVNFVNENFGEMTPAWWANIKLFAGQDYPSNFHFFAFDFNMAKNALEKYGFYKIKRADLGREYSSGELQIEALKFSDSEIVNPSHKNILVKRTGALGDVLLTTPIVKHLRSLYGKNVKICIASNYLNIYETSVYADLLYPSNVDTSAFDKVYDLDLVYEKNPSMHVIDAYGLHCFGYTDFDKSTVLFSSPEDYEIVKKKLIDIGITDSKFIVVHMGSSWKNRTWPEKKWKETLDILSKEKKVVIIGSGKDFDIKGENIYSLHGSLSIPQIASLIGYSSCFLGNDSGMLHVAGTTNTPIVGLFTSAKGEYRLPYRKGELGYNCTLIKPDIGCYGCLEKEKPPVTYCGCSRGDYECLELIRPEKVAEEVIKLINN